MRIQRICVYATLFISVCVVSGQTVPQLINYQGRLTDQNGAPLTAALYGLQFRLWDSPTATNASDLIWGQQQNVAVQTNGVFNVILGSPGGSAIPGDTPAVNNIAYAFNGSNCFLGVTIVTSNSVAITSPSEILPRQQLLSVPFAFNALNAASASFASSVAPGSIVNASLTAGCIQNTNLAAAIVTLANLAPRPIGTNVPIGGLAISAAINASNAGPNQALPQSTITITTTGRPVFVFITAANGAASCYLFDDTQSSGAGQIGIQRDEVLIGTYAWYMETLNQVQIPGSLIFLDIPPAGTHTYTIDAVGGHDLIISNAKLVAFEL